MLIALLVALLPLLQTGANPDVSSMQALSARERLNRFKQENVFWRQFEIGQALAAATDRGAIAELEAWLTHDDRHVRGNVAFVLGRLGDPRGFETIAEILADRSRVLRPGHPWREMERAGADSCRSLLRSASAWRLEGPARRGVARLFTERPRCGRHRAVVARRNRGSPCGWTPDRQLERDDPSVRVLAISALEKLNAREALAKVTSVAAGQQEIQFRRP